MDIIVDRNAPLEHKALFTNERRLTRRLSVLFIMGVMVKQSLAIAHDNKLK